MAVFPRIKGFTLIELMIVVVVVAILASIAVPSYLDYVRKSRRTDAQQALLNLELQQEKYRSSNTDYAPDADLTFPDSDYYDFDSTVTTVSVNGNNTSIYLLEADAKAGTTQIQDTQNSVSCANLDLGLQFVAGTGGNPDSIIKIRNPSDCWQS